MAWCISLVVIRRSYLIQILRAGALEEDAVAPD